MKMHLKRFQEFVGWRYILSCVIALWLGSFAYFFLTTSTITEVQLVFGILLGSASFLVLMALSSVLCIVLFLTLNSSAAMSSREKSLMVMSPIIFCTAVLFAAGWWQSRPATRFRELFDLPLSLSSAEIESNGSFGVDGQAWIFTCSLPRTDMSEILVSHGYAKITDEKGPTYWEKRFSIRLRARWATKEPYILYEKKTGETQRLVFVNGSNTITQFVYCNYRDGF